MRTRITIIITMMFISSILALSATARNDKGRIVIISDSKGNHICIVQHHIVILLLGIGHHSDCQECHQK